MKKCLPLLCLLLALLLTACGCRETKTDSSGEIHPHTFSEHGFDATHHFLVCECGERDKVAAHDFTEGDFCETCGFYISDMGDGYYSVYIHDEFGSIVHQMDYDPDGKIFCDWTAEYEYYDDQNPKHIKEYLDGILQSEQSFLPCENPDNGDVYIAEDIYYNEDGSQEIVVYDEYGYIRSVSFTDSLGEIITREDYTYELDADGNCTHEIVHTNGVLAREIFYEMDADGCAYPAHYFYYNENGEIDSDLHYDAFGNEIA